jgi:hypothetical protein
MTQKFIDFNLIKNKKITIGTPMYGGTCYVGYVNSMIELSKICAINNIEINFLFTYNQALITKARNDIAHDFLESDFDYLFFIDADISFDPLDLLYMVQLAITDKEKQIICGAYPKKKINWPFIKKAEEEGLIQNSEDYIKYQSLYAINITADGEKGITFSLDEPLQVYQSATGFMLIAKEVFNKFKKSYPEQNYIDEDDKKEKMAFFDCKINPETKFYMPEDWMFCYYARQLSIFTWILPWISLSHFGTHQFMGNFKEHSKAHKVLLDRKL